MRLSDRGSMSARKPVDQRQRRGTRAVGDTGGVVVPISAAVSDPPPCPDSWAESTVGEWAEFWRSDVGRIAAETDIPAVRRMFNYRDMSDRLMDAFAEKPTVLGSTRQEKVNPALDKMLKLAPLIAMLEQQFGLTPKARLGLGLDVANVADRLDSINRAFESPLDPDVIELIEQAK